VRQATGLLGEPAATLLIDDTAIVKQGRASVSVTRQY
jgi:SRSO17 transposase